MRIFSDKMLLVSSSMLAQVMRILGTVVMARFVGPKENGAYLLIFIYTGFVMAMGDFAVPQSLVQIQGFSDRVLVDTAILLEGAIYALYGVVTVVTGMFLTHHYADPRLWKVAIIVAVTNMLTCTYAVQLASLNRNLKFAAESRQNVVLSVSSALAGIGFAMAGWGVYAIALQLLIGQIAANIVLQFKVPLKWPSHGSWTVAKRYMKLGTPISAASYVWSVEGSIIGAIISSFGGEWAVGLWGKAVQVQQLFAQNIMAAFQRVAYPLLCRSIANPRNLKVHFGRLTVTLMLVSLWMTAVVGANSRAIVALVLGPDWVASGSLLRITAWAIPAGALLTIGYMLCLALGISGAIFKSAAVNLVIFVPVLLVARRWELVGLATCWSVTRYFVAGATLRAGTKRIAVGLGSVWRELARLAVCAAVSCASMFAALRMLPPHLHLIFSFILSCAVGTVVYGALVLLIEREALAYAIRIARGDQTPEEPAGSDSEKLRMLAASMPEPADSTNSFLAANSLQPGVRVAPGSGTPPGHADGEAIS
ncbi:MAG: oligosaccharide flippase family protein [Tepidisphaeraceae bacterium]